MKKMITTIADVTAPGVKVPGQRALEVKVEEEKAREMRVVVADQVTALKTPKPH